MKTIASLLIATGIIIAIGGFGVFADKKEKQVLSSNPAADTFYVFAVAAGIIVIAAIMFFCAMN